MGTLRQLGGGAAIRLRVDTAPMRVVKFTTIYDPKQMPGQRESVLSWPYVEGLRMDEAMHPLALLCFGMYGAVLPNQDGAPLRIVVPWKYGIKSAKAIVKIEFTESQPISTWNEADTERIRLLLQCKPERGSSALEPGQRASVGGIRQASDAHVQRLLRSSGQSVQRHGPEEILLGLSNSDSLAQTVGFS